MGAEEVTEEASTAVSPGCRVEDETSGVSDKEVPALSEKMGGTQCRGTRRGSREKCSQEGQPLWNPKGQDRSHA